MPIPGSKLNTPNIQASGLFLTPDPIQGDVAFPSFATFFGITATTAADGQEVHSFAAIDGAHSNIPCRKAPSILIRPQMQELNAGGVQVEAQKYQVSLDRYLSDIDLRWQIQITTNTFDANGDPVVTTVLYQVRSVEHSGGNLRTRVMAEELEPFNA